MEFEMPHVPCEELDVLNTGFWIILSLPDSISVIYLSISFGMDTGSKAGKIKYHRSRCSRFDFNTSIYKIYFFFWEQHQSLFSRNLILSLSFYQMGIYSSRVSSRYLPSMARGMTGVALCLRISGTRWLLLTSPRARPSPVSMMLTALSW